VRLLHRFRAQATRLELDGECRVEFRRGEFPAAGQMSYPLPISSGCGQCCWSGRFSARLSGSQ